MVAPTFAALSHGGPAAAATITPEAAAALEALHPPQALVVSCGLYDLAVAQPSGMQTCWVRRIRDGGEADTAAREVSDVPLDMVVERLDEVCVRLFGEGWAQGEQGAGGGVVVGAAAGAVDAAAAAAAAAADGGVEEAAESSLGEEEVVSLSGGEDSEVEVVRVVRVAAAAEEI